MNEELQTTLNTALVDVIEAAAMAKDFIVAETPEVISQLLMWKATVSIALFMVFMVCVIASIVTIRKFLKARLTPLNDDEKEFQKTLMILGYSGRSLSQDVELRRLSRRGYPHTSKEQYAPYLIPIFFLLMSGVAGATAVKILIAPKLYLVEYAVALVK